MLMTEDKTMSEIAGIGNPIQALKRLRDENGASLKDAKAALEDADFDIEEARRLLRERGQETPKTREVRITEHIEYLEEHKRFLRQQFEEEMADLDR
jgi:DNA-binding transcriptional MerR regulator